jgi:hypothetical protein
MLTLTAVVWSPASSAAVRWFYSPSGNIGCEVAAADPRGTYAHCQTVNPPRSVVLKANGHSRICRGTSCLGNGPENAFKLGYGHSVRVGPFSCTSRTDGMRCVVTRTGHGFLLSRQSLKLF